MPINRASEKEEIIPTTSRKQQIKENFTFDENFIEVQKDVLAGDKDTILIGTVWGDMHDIGKNIVVTILRGVGYEIKDLGINIKARDFVRHVAQYKPDILGLSALLTTTMPQMKKVIEKLEAAALRDEVKIVVGGAPVNQKFADDIGADGYAADAGSSVSLIKELLARL